MKPLTDLLNTEKARLLHQLFPQEIPALLKYMQGVCMVMQENPLVYHQLLDNGFDTIEHWQTYTADMNKKLQHYGDRLSKRSRLFANQLFDGDITRFTLYCLKLYRQTILHPNPRFMMAIDLLFNL